MKKNIKKQKKQDRKILYGAIVMSLCLGLVLTVVAYGASQREDADFRIVELNASMAKPAIVSDQRLVFVNNYTSSDGRIRCYAAGSDWQLEEQLAVSSYPVEAYYVYTYPNVFPDLALIVGTVDSGHGFIMSYNVATRSFEDFAATAMTNYFTQVSYLENRNLFLIMPVGGPLGNSVLSASPEGLFDLSSWVIHDITNVDGFDGYEHMVTGQEMNGLLYMVQWSSGFSSRIIAWNLTDNTMTYPFNYTQPGAGAYARQYITANSTCLFFSVADNSSSYRYYYSTDGQTFVNFKNQTMIGNPGSEWHGLIAPYQNMIILGDVRDGNNTSGYMITNTDGDVLSKYQGVDTHYSEGFPLVDQGYLVFGGEGAYQVTTAADLYRLRIPQ